jgi:formate hydrogenlyase transcriptional activator
MAIETNGVNAGENELLTADRASAFIDHPLRCTLDKTCEETGRTCDRDSQPAQLSHDCEASGRGVFSEIIGSSEAIQHVLTHVTRVAPTDCTVLITGESGTGKELIARAIHNHSARYGRPFIRVNCASLPTSLIASELFGYERGAFTGAVQRRLGRFELANGGTIFLDEVGDIPHETQIALLRVLQEREIERVGGSRPVAVDVRVIAATNRNLKAAVDTGTFRLDLFYRLNVFPIRVPSLRERKEDIPTLAEHFIGHYASKAGMNVRPIGKKTLEMLEEYSWPGNIRELQNIIERAVIYCDGDRLEIDKSWLDEGHSEPFGTARHPEKSLIEVALEKCRGRVAGPSGAAVRLGIPRQTLESKIKTLRINKHGYRSTCPL